MGKGRVHEEDGNGMIRSDQGLETSNSKRARKKGLGTASSDKERSGGTSGNSRPIAGEEENEGEKWVHDGMERGREVVT